MKPILCLLSGLIVTACASTDPAPVAMRGDAPSSVQQAMGEDLPGLGPQNLQPGACALFLFTQRVPRRFAFFSEAGTDRALVDLEGTETAMSRGQTGGGLFGQFMTQMTYSDGDQTVAVTLEPGEEIDGGQRVETGRLLVTDKDGWETVIPVLGLRACQPEQAR